MRSQSLVTTTSSSGLDTSFTSVSLDISLNLLRIDVTSSWDNSVFVLLIILLKNSSYTLILELESLSILERV